VGFVDGVLNLMGSDPFIHYNFITVLRTRFAGRSPELTLVNTSPTFTLAIKRLASASGSLGRST
jgi:hypothetical protein